MFYTSTYYWATIRCCFTVPCKAAHPATPFLSVVCSMAVSKMSRTVSFCAGEGCADSKKQKWKWKVGGVSALQNPAISYIPDDKTTDTPYFMFALNIPMCTRPMTAHSGADLSQPLSAQLTRQRHGTQLYTVGCRRPRRKTKHTINTNLQSIHRTGVHWHTSFQQPYITPSYLISSPKSLNTSNSVISLIVQRREGNRAACTLSVTVALCHAEVNLSQKKKKKSMSLWYRRHGEIWNDY